MGDLGVLFLDMNAYFASVEQQLRPELRHRPIAVAPVNTDSTCCIAASYEAKKFNISTGTNVSKAKRLCPDLVVVEARPAVYIRYHHAIVEAVESCLHVDTVLSIDEMACRLIGRETKPTQALALAKLVKQTLSREVGQYLRCSIGLAPNRFLAKVASSMQKPDGIVCIESQDLPSKLCGLTLTDLPGIGKRMHNRLQQAGINTVEQLYNLSEKQLVKLWHSVLGTMWWHQLRGYSLPETLIRRHTLGHSHVLPPQQRNDRDARAVLIRLIHKAAARLRYMGFWTACLMVHILYDNQRHWQEKIKLATCQDTLTLIEGFLRIWPQRPHGTPLRVGVHLLNLTSHEYATIPLIPSDQRRIKLAKVMDELNAKFGNNTIYLGGMHDTQHSAPTRIAFGSIPELNIPV